MIKYVKLSIFLLLSFTLSAQSIVGGAGICMTNGNPNSITSLSVINSLYSCTIVKDTTTGVLYSYDNTKAVGLKWVIVPHLSQDSTLNWLVGGNTVSAAGVLGTNTAQDLIFRTNSVERMRILSNGNDQSVIKQNTSGAYYTEYVTKYDSGEPFYVKNGAIKMIGSKSIGLTSSTVYLNNYYDLAFSTGATDNPTLSSVKMIVRQDGKVGIGTTSPSAGLDINNTLRVRSFASGTNTDSLLTSSGDGTLNRRTVASVLTNYFASNSIIATSAKFTIGATDGYIAKTDALGNLSWTDPSVITGWSVNGATAYNKNSKIGIGTLIPTYKLDVDSRAYGTEPLRLKGLLQGNLTDSILSSANGVVKRLSIAEVNNIVGENIISVNATISAGSDLSDGTTPFTTTMSGVSIGDYVDVMIVPNDNNLTDINVKAWVSATNTVSYQIENKRATTVVFTNKDLKIRVRK